MIKPAFLAVLSVALAAQAELRPDAIEALLNATADELTVPLEAEGRGYSYYTYGTRELRYVLGDLDGDDRPELVARGVYFMGVGSYDLVDVFADSGDGYRRVDFLNLYELGLQDRVESLEIRDRWLRITTTGYERGGTVRACAEIRWRGPQDIVRREC